MIFKNVWESCDWDCGVVTLVSRCSTAWRFSREATIFFCLVTKDIYLCLLQYSAWLKKRRLPKLPMFRLRGLNEKFLEESKQLLDQFLQDLMQVVELE